jgi:hypothetical protein
MTISYPEQDEARAATRCILEMLAQFTPVTAALARLYGYTHPSEFEQDRERFFRDLAGSANLIEERITRLEGFFSTRITVSNLALEIAFYVLRTDNIGRSGNLFQFTALRDHFSSVETPLLEEAVAELEHSGYLSIFATMSQPISCFTPETALYLAFDRAATGRDTSADAVEIARLWLQDNTLHIIPQLRDRLGWEPRRLNPALSALRYVFSESGWSELYDASLVTLRVLISPSERFRLRRIVESGRIDDTRQAARPDDAQKIPQHTK